MWTHQPSSYFWSVLSPSLTRALYYIVMQCLGAICGAGVVKGFQPKQYQALGGGANTVAHGYTKGSGLGAEIIGTFVLVYTVFSATDAKRNARDSHVPAKISVFREVLVSWVCALYWVLFQFVMSVVRVILQTSHTQNRLCLKINSLAIRVCKLLRSSPTSPLGGVVIDKLLKICWKDAKAS